MQSDYILLVCPAENDASLVKQTGQLALALKSQKKDVCILTQTPAESSLLSPLSPSIAVYTCMHQTTFPWQLPLKQLLKNIIEEKGEPKAVQFMDITPQLTHFSRFCQKRNIPVLGVLRDAGQLQTSALSFFHKRPYEDMLQYMSPLVVHSPYLLDLCRDQHLQVTYIPEGVAIDRFKPVLSKRPPRRKLDLPESGTLVCCMAHIHPENKQLEALELCQPLHDYLRIVFLGAVKDADYMDALRHKAKELGVEDYIYYRDRAEEPEQYLQASDVFMLLGGVPERQTTVLEGLCCGLPLVLGPSAVSHFLTDGEKRGFIWQKDKPQTKSKIEKLLNDPGYRQGRATHSKDIRKEHSLKMMAESYIQLYETL